MISCLPDQLPVGCSVPGMMGRPSSVGSGRLPPGTVSVSGLSAGSLSLTVDDGDRISDVEDATDVAVLGTELSASSPRSDACAVAGTVIAHTLA
jgi:hypothetical protein